MMAVPLVVGSIVRDLGEAESDAGLELTVILPHPPCTFSRVHILP